MNSEVVKTIDKLTRKITIRIFVSFIATLLVVLVIMLKPIELRTYDLPSSLAPAQELFRYQFQDSIYIPSLYEKRVSRLYDYLILKMKYGGLLQEFEQPKQQDIPSNPPKDSPGMLAFPDTEEQRESLLYVALPAYIAGSNEAGRPVEYGYEFEIAIVPSKKK
ncbi:hypothetical protein QP794_23520 [Paenibacillus sp. UMB7766-LJ446]|uniref:hypothetical protein n=1 Tax=Paenibacillus sp. UMB7766-LJ446 TaxID=3046313 RepID=UPI00254E5946|nr:hypothetical protein [Paenibacillus sp. UMB7766-LJ446]MDK8193063.1 hypothetical protein [Paenibacillus sp. UMB7766-LJ446]